MLEFHASAIVWTLSAQPDQMVVSHLLLKPHTLRILIAMDKAKETSKCRCPKSTHDPTHWSRT
jgi:hypothetical protein